MRFVKYTIERAKVSGAMRNCEAKLAISEYQNSDITQSLRVSKEMALFSFFVIRILRCACRPFETIPNGLPFSTFRRLFDQDQFRARVIARV